MATISADANFDAAARTAGEAFTINQNATLTIRTDTRYHKNAPAAGAGAVSSFTMTAATGGRCLIDGTQAWQIPYDGGTGNVPALGSTVTGLTSGATGELMNVSSAISAAPTAAGAAMPATGIVKLTTKSGTFQDNENLQVTGVTFAVVNSATGGKRSFIEVIMDDLATFTIGRAQKFQTTADWYEVDVTTSGARGQQVQLPNYGGGANTYYPGIWIETGVGTDVYEFWPAVLAGTGSPWATANMGTDARAKFVQCLASGIIRIGSDGTNNLGDLPVSGCKMRIPNILCWSCATASRASNSVPNGTLATRPDFVTTNAGQVDIDGMIGHWQVNLSQAYSVSLKRIALFDQFTITECATVVVLENGGNGGYTVAADIPGIVLTSNFAGVTATDWKAGRSGTIGANDWAWNVQYCFNVALTRCHFQHRVVRANAAAYALYLAYCSDVALVDCVAVGNCVYMLACSRITITGQQYADNYVGTSSATGAPSGVIQAINRTSDLVVDGFNWFTSVANVHPDLSILYVLAAVNVTMRNIGTLASPLSAGSSNAMLYVCNDAGNSSNLRFQRVYFDLVATTFLNAANSTKGVVIENCSGNNTVAKNLVSAVLNQQVYNTRLAGLAPASTASIYGSIFYHHFTSSSAGRLGLVPSEPTAEMAPYVTTNFTSSATGVSGFNSSNGVALVNSGDYVIFEFQRWIIGIDSFQNVAPTVTTSTNLLVEYQIDTGAGWNGTWKTFNATNLSGETVDEVAGFRFKIKISATATNAANLLTVLYCLTNSNAAAQGQQYPLDTVAVAVTALDASTSAEIEAARILLRASSGATVTITRSSSTATVTHTAHGYRSGAKVVISGAAEGEYNGLKTITVIDANSYSFTVSGTPATPATGTITSYRVVLDTTTDVNGLCSADIELTTATLAVVGTARRASSAPYYKPSPLSGTITSAGLSLTTFLVGDA